MADNFQYWNSVVDNRSLLVDPAAALAGEALLSAETQSDCVEASIRNYVDNHFDSFLRYTRLFRPEDQELLMSYYVIHQTQRLAGALTGTTQTVCSFRLRLLVRALCAYMLWGGHPPVEVVARVLTKAGVEDQDLDSPTGLVKVKLSEVIETYRQSQSFVHTAAHYGVNRPEVRRRTREVARQMIGNDDNGHLVNGDIETTSLGCYLFILMDRTGNERGVKPPRITGDVHRSDPDCCGEFRIDILDPGFSSIFSPKNNLM